MLRGQLEVKKNLQMLDGLIRGKQRDYQEFITEDNEILLSENLLSTLATNNDLTKYVKNIPVLRANGSYPYMNIQSSELASVSELVKDLEAQAEPVKMDLVDNPLIQASHIPNINITPIDYVIETYRGKLDLSIELGQDIEDSGIDLGLVLADISNKVDKQTKNREIISLFKSATPKSVTGTDELISLINGYPTAYGIKLYISSSLYDVLDKVGLIEYTEGRAEFKGKEVVKIDDTKIGETQGDLVGFVGDAYNYIHLFDRNKVTLKHTVSKTFSTPINIATRFNVKVADDEAGNFITFVEA